MSMELSTKITRAQGAARAQLTDTKWITFKLGPVLHKLLQGSAKTLFCVFPLQRKA